MHASAAVRVRALRLGASRLVSTSTAAAPSKCSRGVLHSRAAFRDLCPSQSAIVRVQRAKDAKIAAAQHAATAAGGGRVNPGRVVRPRLVRRTSRLTSRDRARTKAAVGPTTALAAPRCGGQRVEAYNTRRDETTQLWAAVQAGLLRNSGEQLRNSELNGASCGHRQLCLKDAACTARDGARRLQHSCAAVTMLEASPSGRRTAALSIPRLSGNRSPERRHLC